MSAIFPFLSECVPAAGAEVFLYATHALYQGIVGNEAKGYATTCIGIVVGCVLLANLGSAAVGANHVNGGPVRNLIGRGLA